MILALSVVAALIGPAVADDPTEWTAEPLGNTGSPSVIVTDDLVAGTDMVKITNPGLAALGANLWNGVKVTSPENFSMMLNANTTEFIFDIIYEGPGTTNRAFNVEVAGFDASGKRLFYDMQAAGTATANQPVNNWRRIAVNSVVYPGGAIAEVTKLEISIRLNNTAYNTPIYISNFRLGTAAIPAAYVARFPGQELYSNKVVLGPDNLDIPSKVNIADTEATASALGLYAYLYAVGKSDYVLWGVQNPYNTPSTSPAPAGRGYPGATGNDFHDMAGVPVSIIGFDGLSFAQHERYSGYTGSGGTWADRNARIAGLIQTAVQQSKDYNAIIHLSLHMPNFGRMVDLNPTARTPEQYYTLINNTLANYNSETTASHWGCRVLNGNTMMRILPGGDANAAYNTYLDLIADFSLGLQAQGISYMFRPYHEFNGNFFWWGAPYTTPEGFRNVWRYTVDYLKDKGVHNALYVFNYNHRVTDEISFADYYPGDDYVDVVSFDRYSTPVDQWNESVQILTEFAESRGKIVSVGEYGGGSGAAGTGAFQQHTQHMFDSLGRSRTTGAKVPGRKGDTAWMMIWHQGGGGSYPNMTSTTRGTAGVTTFARDFINSDYTVFGDGSMSFEALAELDVEPVERGPRGWFAYPIADSFVNGDVTVQARLSYPKGAVSIKLVSGDTTVSKAATLNTTTGLYEATFTQAEVWSGIPAGKVNAFGKLYIIDGDETRGYTQVILGPSFAKPNDIVDTYEEYSGNDEILNSIYRKKGTTNIELSLQQRYLAPNSEYGLKYEYSVEPKSTAPYAAPIGTTEEQVGFMMTRTLPNGQNPSLANYNAFQFYMKPDGKGQRVVVRCQTVNGEREFFLTNFAATTEPMIVTIPFSSFGGMVIGTPANELNITASAWATGKWRQLSEFGIFVSPRVSLTEKVEGTLYFDDIKFLNLTTAELNALNLSYASNGLQQGADFKPFDAKAGLKAAIASFELLNGSTYTATTWAAAKAAYDAAVLVNADADAWAVDIKAAAAALQSAMGDLVVAVLKLADGQPGVITIRRGQTVKIALNTTIDFATLECVSAVPVFATAANNGSEITVTGISPGISVVRITDPWSGITINIPINVVT